MLAKRIRTLPLFWQVYIFIVGVLLLVVGFTELALEPLAELLLFGRTEFTMDWYEGPVWILSITLPSLACGYILSQKLTRKLDPMAKAARSLARGNFSIKLPVSGNEKDAFDILSRSFNEMSSAIERQLYNERRLLTDISHELRSPLTRMTIAAELLDRDLGGTEHAPLIRRLMKEVSQMRDLVTLLLAQGRDRITQTHDLSILDLSDVLRTIIDDCRFQGQKQRKSITPRIAGPLYVHANEFLLRSILSNVLANALSHTSPGQEVAVAAEHAGGDVVVTMRDYGPGVPAKQLQDIFRAFYRVDNSRTRASGGAGLGLALAKAAVDDLGGSIDAQNASPGLAVTIRLPRPLLPNEEEKIALALQEAVFQ